MELPTQAQVNEFFIQTQNELHYLNSKPINGWDEYDLANWNSLVTKAKGIG